MGMLDFFRGRRTANDSAPLPAPAMPPMPKTAGRDGLVSLMRGGLGSNADHTEMTFYAPVPQFNQQKAGNAYVGSWLARRIVDLMAEDMTREWVKPSWKDHDNDIAGARALTAEENRLNVRGIYTEGWRWTRLFGGGGIVMGIKGQDLTQPLELDKIGKGDLEWLAYRDRWYLVASGGWIDTPGPLMGYPDGYNMVNAAASTQMATIHHSRVIRLAGDPLPLDKWLSNGRWDDSVLQSPFNAVRRYDAMTGGLGSLIWEAKKDVISIDDLRTQLSYEEGEGELAKRFSAMATASTLFGITLLDGKDKYDRKQISFAGLPELLREFRSDVAGAAGYPLTILFGDAPGGLNATGNGEQRSYYDKVKSKQNGLMRPGLRLLYEVLTRSAFGKPVEEFDFDFNPLWQIPETDRATIGLSNAQRDQINNGLGVPKAVILKTLKENKTYGALDDAAIASAEKLDAMPPPDLEPPPDEKKAPVEQQPTTETEGEGEKKAA